MEHDWHEIALSPPHAFGPPVLTGRLRVEPEDFQVEENLGFAADGAGPHLLLKVRKRNANTEWVARELARELRCPARDVGYAGLKDRRAVAVQWFSVPRSAHAAAAAPDLAGEGFQVLEVHGHGRKLPRGALAGNIFRIRVRGLRAAQPTDRLTGQPPAQPATVREILHARLECAARHGVPNYFGPQRFGRDGGNLGRVAAACEQVAAGHLPRRGPDTGFVLSSARSLIFNAVLAERVRDGSWHRLTAGDMANLDGRGSVFAVEEVTADLSQRALALDLHPTGPLWGRGEPAVRDQVLQLEQRVAQGLTEPCGLLAAAGLRQERRSLRLRLQQLSYEIRDDELDIGFALGRGSFATAVLRELLALQPGAAELDAG